MVPISGKKIFSERRTKTRITCTFTAVVRGHDADGKEFEDRARVLNLSAGGVYMLLNRPVYAGGRVSMQIALPFGTEEPDRPGLMTEGTILREEAYLPGFTGVAVKFDRHRFTNQGIC